MKINLVSFVVGIGIFFTGCTHKNLDIPEAAEYINIYIPQAHSNPNLQNVYIVDSAQTVTYSAFFGGPSAPGSDVSVTFGVNLGLADSFNLKNNTTYAVMPEGSYELEESTAVIPASELSTPLLKIKIATLGHLEVDKSYLLPVTITQVSGNYRINEKLKTLYFLFTGGYAPGEIIHWSDFNLILPFDKYWIVRKPTGELLRYPVDAAGNFGPSTQLDEGWDQFDVVFSYGNTIMARKIDGELLKFPIDEAGNLGSSTQAGLGWDIYRTITSYGHSLVAINKTDATLWFYTVDGDGNIQQGREIGQGWGEVNPVIGSTNALLARLPGQFLRFPVDVNGNFDYGNIGPIGAGIAWDDFDMIVWDKNALVARKPNGELWSYPVDVSGNVGDPQQIGK